MKKEVNKQVGRGGEDGHRGRPEVVTEHTTTINFNPCYYFGGRDLFLLQIKICCFKSFIGNLVSKFIMTVPQGTKVVVVYIHFDFFAVRTAVACKVIPQYHVEQKQ